MARREETVRPILQQGYCYGGGKEARQKSHEDRHRGEAVRVSCLSLVVAGVVH